MTELREEFIEQAKFLARNAEVLPGGVEELAYKLQYAKDNNKPLRVKLGMDPTRPDLHLGHTVVMRKLKEFQALGHKIVLLVGGATAMIGDPSGKSETRPALSKEQVEENAGTYFEQMSKVLDVSKAEVVNNADWLHKMTFTELLSLASKVTVAQMMTRDDFAKRYAEGKPISIVEFYYPLMQAYDSVAIDADIELGGSDQRFNTLLGRDIQAAYGKKYPQLVVLLPLLEGTDGVVKMSKTYPEHCISLTDSAKDMFGKLMSIPDNMITRYFSLLTDTTKEDLEKYDKEIADGSINPRDLKMKLAHTITAEYHGNDGADKAQEEFINVVSNKGVPDDIKEVNVENGKSVLDLIVELGFTSSRGEAKRLIQGGGVKIDGNKIADTGYAILFDDSVVLQAGKRKFAKLVH
ncbi:MAG: tyrosine--tRNA ligase [Cyanobacteriota bacterium]|nr:tyrosine--tRNA ligase [Cyanobacteriota bacterium]MDY6358701.1 tyrosine--tRNA ligase [Cyanobacteriota bacterium]MDY6364874.1 tyrosine--tRNA ligase [Cyanobacteriota bacterium]MDY6383080.1 tyrosine--tRNA ligase [Cyanobacteriota bacterium]